MPHRVLIVDDEPHWRGVLAHYLDRLGYETLQAEDLRQAIDQTIAQRPDVIVTDLWLPDMNAVDAVVVLKQDPFTSKIPVVVLTGMEDVRWQEKALQAGVIKYLVKPISLSELGAVVKSLG
jgi:chemotaxis family two-component system response regulator PixH